MDARMPMAAVLTNVIAQDWKEDQEAQAVQDCQPQLEIMVTLDFQGHQVQKEKKVNGENTEMQVNEDLG